MKEEWKDVVGYEEYFKVSNKGRVWSKRSDKILKQESLSSQGYKIFSTRIGGRQGECICFRVHILVAEAFLPEPDRYKVEWARTTKYGKVYVNHIDSNKANNNIENLEWVTNPENYSHYRKTSKYTVDSLRTAKARATLEDHIVLAIREEYSTGNTSERKLAKKYNVSRGIISTAIKGYAWLNNP